MLHICRTSTLRVSSRWWWRPFVPCCPKIGAQHTRPRGNGSGPRSHEILRRPPWKFVPFDPSMRSSSLLCRRWVNHRWCRCWMIWMLFFASGLVRWWFVLWIIYVYIIIYIYIFVYTERDVVEGWLQRPTLSLSIIYIYIHMYCSQMMMVVDCSSFQLSLEILGSPDRPAVFRVFKSPVSRRKTAGRAAGVLQEYHLHRLLHQVCSESGPVQAVPVKASLHCRQGEGWWKKTQFFLRKSSDEYWFECCGWGAWYRHSSFGIWIARFIGSFFDALISRFLLRCYKVPMTCTTGTRTTWWTICLPWVYAMWAMGSRSISLAPSVTPAFKSSNLWLTNCLKVSPPPSCPSAKGRDEMMRT